MAQLQIFFEFFCVIIRFTDYCNLLHPNCTKIHCFELGKLKNFDLIQYFMITITFQLKKKKKNYFKKNFISHHWTKLKKKLWTIKLSTQLTRWEYFWLVFEHSGQSQPPFKGGQIAYSQKLCKYFNLLLTFNTLFGQKINL